MLQNNQKELILLKDLGMLYHNEKSKIKYRYGLYKCFCGQEFTTRVQSVNNKSTKSCGCFKNKFISQSQTKHGFRKHRLYNIWNQMMNRCFNNKNINYKHYGSRGITVCSEWLNIKNFIEDMYPTFQEGLTLDREDNDLGYNPSNCRWTTLNVQHSNTRVLYSHNTSGYRGVSFNKINKKWICTISVNDSQIYLGSFDNAVEAAKAYDQYVIDNKLEHNVNFITKSNTKTN